MTNTQRQIDRLIGLEAIKTWSLIVTLFGDFDGPSLSGKAIRELLERIEIKPEATRVALHRLKKDGWIVTSKKGREVDYQLSDHGFAETRLVYEDVYRKDAKNLDGWRLVLFDETADVDLGKGLRLFKNVCLLPKEVDRDSELYMELMFDSASIPKWFSNRIVPETVVELASQLAELVDGFRSDMASIGSLDRVVVRLLVLHRWRKMALRDATWAHISLFPDGEIANCHHKVTRLLAELPKHTGV